MANCKNGYLRYRNNPSLGVTILISLALNSQTRGPTRFKRLSETPGDHSTALEKVIHKTKHERFEFISSLFVKLSYPIKAVYFESYPTRFRRREMRINRILTAVGV